MNIKINSEIIRNIRLVIFDKDGTLIDLYNYWSNMVNFRASVAQSKLDFNEEIKKEIMYAMGIDLKRKKIRPGGPVGLKKREIVMKVMSEELEKMGFCDVEDLCFNAFKEADILSLNHLSKIIKPLNGMHELIENLHKKGCKIAIATTDKTERAGLAADVLGISDKIDMIVGEDMVKNCKPSPEMVKLILNTMKIPRENAVMVGDALTDVKMGINAGLTACIGVCSGLTSRESLLEKTKYVVEDISKIVIE